MEHWEALKPGGLRFVWEDALFRPGTDTFLLSSLPRLKPGLRVCDLGCGTGLLGLLLLQRQRGLAVTGVELQPEAAALLERAASENGLTDRLTVRRGAEPCAWSTSRSGWRTSSAPSAPPAWSPSGCAPCAGGRRSPLPWCFWRPAGAESRVSPGSRP